MKQEKNMVADMAGEILATSQDLNAILATGGIRKLVMTHYVNTEKEIAGIEQLVRSILQSHGATFPKDSHLTEMRSIVINGGMFLNEIESEVRKAFGFERYPSVTLRVYLSQRMKDICTAQLTSVEDATGKRPRRKYYLAE